MTAPSMPRRFLRYPIIGFGVRDALDRAVARLPFTYMYCPACGRLARSDKFSSLDLRETGRCRECGATNRQRQMATAVLAACRALAGVRARSLADLHCDVDLEIYNAESNGAVHAQLRRLKGYKSSEFLGPGIESGRVIDGLEHQDLLALSFESESLDIVLTSDVLEHVPDPYRAHEEIYRVLRPGGRHLFTVPFHQMGYADDCRAIVDADGEVAHLAPPIYHDDPVHPEQGVLVFTIFGIEMLVRLRTLGFVTFVYALHRPARGIFGPNGLVFEAVKGDWGWR